MTIAVLNGSESYVPFNILDTSGNPFTPTSLSYQVWDTTNNLSVVPPTGISPVQTGTITLDSTVNTMNAASALIEQRRVVLKVGIPGGSFENLEIDYLLNWSPGTP